MNHSKSTTAYIKSPTGSGLKIKPLLKDGLTMEDIKLRNEKTKETETLFNQFYSLLSDNDIKDIRKFLRRNEDYPIDEYKFVKQNGRLTFIHDSHYHPTFDKVNYEENNEIPYEQEQSSLSSKWNEINNSGSYDEFQNLINEFNKLYEKVEKIYIFASKFKYLSLITSLIIFIIYTSLPFIYHIFL